MRAPGQKKKEPLGRDVKTCLGMDPGPSLTEWVALRKYQLLRASFAAKYKVILSSHDGFEETEIVYIGKHSAQQHTKESQSLFISLFMMLFLYFLCPL